MSYATFSRTALVSTVDFLQNHRLTRICATAPSHRRTFLITSRDVLLIVPYVSKVLREAAVSEARDNPRIRTTWRARVTQLLPVELAAGVMKHHRGAGDAHVPVPPGTAQPVDTRRVGRPAA